MPTTTTTYSFNKPVVGADEDDWGGYLNGNWDSVDDLLDGTTPVTGIDINSGTLDGVTIGGTTAGAGTFTNLTATGTTTLAGASTSADITFGDNDKAIFGAGSELSIFHDGNNKIEAVSGYLRLASTTSSTYVDGNNVYIRSGDGGETLARFNDDSDVKLYYDNSQKLATTSTGVDITGTLTSDGLTVDGDANLSGTAVNFDLDETDTTDLNTRFRQSSGQLFLQTANDAKSVGYNRLNINHSTGDISFYEDTGTTAKFFWDASAESLGIGTSSPATNLEIRNASAPATLKMVQSGAGQFTITTESGLTTLAVPDTGGGLAFGTGTGGAERMRIDSSGNVDIGSTGGGVKLAVAGAVGPQNGTAAAPTHTFYSDTNTGMFRATVDTLGFSTAGSERMRIDSSGNLLVGTTDSTLYNNSTGGGANILSDGLTTIARETATASDTVFVLNDTGAGGSIQEFRKDGTTVGSIGTKNGALHIGSTTGSDSYLGFYSNSIIPTTSDGSDRDNVIDLGYSGSRFDDIYATNGTIQTSDANEKQDIAELTDAEQRVAVAAKGLLRKFRWRDAVEEKGDEARTHFGIIAQDLQAAFAAEGLDAGDYAMFIHSTWTDEETGEERSRMGVRYSELLAFIIAAI